MSPQRAQRRMARTLLAGVVGIVALIVSVWLVGAKSASDIRESESKARQEQATRVEAARVVQTASLRAGCARGVARDFEAWGTNRDLRNFAREAAKARHASGDHVVARRYAGIASRAHFRMRRIRLRLPNREDDAAITAFCRTLYPDPAKG